VVDKLEVDEGSVPADPVDLVLRGLLCPVVLSLAEDCCFSALSSVGELDELSDRGASGLYTKGCTFKGSR
jgi:hypothetical protein